jgi:error-prone DNA polymerase
LHCHSNFSFLEGASHIEELVLRAAELGQKALALTDHDGLHGAMEFAQCARAWGLQPITGAEVTLADGHHLTLLCESQRGYANLCRMLSRANLDHERGQPRVEPDVLAQHAEGLIALSGCRRGEVPSLVAAGRYWEAEEAARRYVEWFGAGNFLIELQHNLVYSDQRRNRALAGLAEQIGAGVVATGNVHYHKQERHRLQDVLVAIKNRTSLDASHRLRRANSEFYMRSAAEMASATGGFRDQPDAIANAERIAERCQFDLTRDLDYRFPDYPAPPGETPQSYLRKICQQEAALRYPHFGPEIERRLDKELALVERHGLAGFFLIHREILQLAHQVAQEVKGRPYHGPPGRGRGSSVGSVICYLIGLSHIDPIANNLFLGRFLNEEMASVPDIDLDFARDIREKLMLRVYEHFGGEHVGLVATFPTYRIRGAVREVGKALGLPPAELDRLAKASDGFGSAKEIGEAMSRIPHYRDKLGTSSWRHLAELVQEIAGFPRHISQHVGGMVISSRPLVELVPLEQSAMEGRVLIQWDKDSVDDARMIKIDFLALGMLSAVDECLDLIEEQRGKRIDLSRINFDDARVYDSICEADTMGVFQIESRAQMQTLPRVRPRDLDDLTVQVAIIRPGPVIGGAVNPYINRRLNRELVTYDHPSLEPVLGETLGVILFQEQVLQTAMALSGFTAGQAESLRRAMSRKRSQSAIEKLKDEFLAGALANGATREAAESVYQKIAGFAAFGFPKSHAAAFGLLAYQTAWLRVYYPAESLCALFNAQPMGFYGPHVLLNDGKRHGIPVLPPDVNRSGADCSIEPIPSLVAEPFQARSAPRLESLGYGGRGPTYVGQDWGPAPRKIRETGLAVRIGLRYVRGLSRETALPVEAERRKNGDFRSLFDFLERTHIKREAVENLIACGAFDGFGLERRELLWQLGLIYRSEGRNAEQRQLTLALPTGQDMAPLRPMTDWDRMAADYSTLGMSPAYHPMSFLRSSLHEAIVPTRMLGSLPHGAPVELAGMVVVRQQPGSAKGFVFLLIEDEFGLANVIVRPDIYEAQRSLVRSAPFVIVHGTLELRDGTTNIAAKHFTELAVPGGLAPEAHNFG